MISERRLGGASASVGVSVSVGPESFSSAADSSQDGDRIFCRFAAGWGMSCRSRESSSSSERGGCLAEWVEFGKSVCREARDEAGGGD
jgi:hypothetical protein